jgi:hypothetical protein
MTMLYEQYYDYILRRLKEERLMTNNIKSFIKIRTEFEGYHFYPNAGDIDSRIKFLENEHRHIFKVEVKISVNHLDRELEFFLIKWALNDFIKSGNQNHKSCEMIAKDILENHLLPSYGDRYYEVVVSEDGESDGIIEYTPKPVDF